jgi:hypothetical protein
MRGIAVLALGVTVVVVVVVTMLGRSTPPDGAQIMALQTALHDPVQHWGRIEVLGMQPAISDLRTGTGVPATTIAAEARAWQDGLAQVGRQLDTIDAPARLAPAMTLFDQALGDYLRAGALVQQATAVEGPARSALLDDAVAAAQNGDCDYDDAGVAIQQARLRAGLGTTTDFPNHACAQHTWR